MNGDENDLKNPLSATTREVHPQPYSGTVSQPPTMTDVTLVSNRPEGTVARPPTVTGSVIGSYPARRLEGSSGLQPVRAEPVTTEYEVYATTTAFSPMAGARVRDTETGMPMDLVPNETMEPFHQQCCISCVTFCGFYAVSMVVALFVAVFLAVPVFGVIMVSAVPAVVISVFAYKWYEPYLTRCSMNVVFLESAFYLLVPLLIFISIIDIYIGLPENCEADEDSDRDWGSFFFQAFFRAGLLEEIVKYLGFRRILWRPYITDARALLVYSCLSGVSFGVIENIGYGLLAGVLLAFYRSFLTVFAHATTGLLMGTYLAEARFVEGAQDQWPWYRVLVIPVLGHGLYDVLLFINAGFCTPPLIALVFLAFLVLLAGVIFTRYRFVKVLRLCPQTNVNVHTKIDSGEIQKPCFLVRCWDCCY